MHRVLVIISLIIAASAYESYLANSRHPDFPDQCFLKQTEELIKFGDVLTPVGICNKFTCRDDYVIRVDHCPRYMVPENCEEIPIDLSKSFPECCVKLRCIDENGNVEIRNTGA